ncbi:hypothetical protein E3A20_04380 [Planctomyces bekefii]|uniref:Uncharacterized protein n=1 Tax=Planctomyces bekefii TaxID=1653850 RepID=A0A5C6MAN6_9PLAN|nr:hypothetical protein E3A20_04380 [Planctomyces bekefii]
MVLIQAVTRTLGAFRKILDNTKSKGRTRIRPARRAPAVCNCSGVADKSPDTPVARQSAGNLSVLRQITALPCNRYQVSACSSSPA